MKPADLKDGTLFRFVDSASGQPFGRTWVARGGLWYSHPEGYDGGPWFDRFDRSITIVQALENSEDASIQYARVPVKPVETKNNDG